MTGRAGVDWWQKNDRFCFSFVTCTGGFASMIDCWDDAVDPFESVAQSGKDDGRSAGLRDGYLEGLNLGTTKGWEMGLELGYYKDFADGIMEAMDRKQLSSDVVTGHQRRRTAERVERCRTLAGDISQMINDFPDPETLLKSNNCDGRLGGVDSSGEVVHSMAILDISSALEGIRIKFKLLCTLLKTKQSFELKSILNLDDRTSDETVESAEDGNRDEVKSESKLSLPIEGVTTLESDW